MSYGSSSSSSTAGSGTTSGSTGGSTGLNLNLPAKQNRDSARDVKRYFNTYYGKELAFPSNDVDAVIGFLESKGFDRSSAVSTGTVILQQAKIDGVKVFELLDTLKGLDKLQLSYTVTQVLNFNRQKISSLGYKVANEDKPTEARNIMG
tara:strand:- start:43 stop:489 length:447 start_codon:yes stop_codon:yes gene_type:complete